MLSKIILIIRNCRYLMTHKLINILHTIYKKNVICFQEQTKCEYIRTLPIQVCVIGCGISVKNSEINTSSWILQVLAVFFSIVVASNAVLGVPKLIGVPGQKLTRTHKVNADLCPLCVEFTDEALDILLNIILSMSNVNLG